MKPFIYIVYLFQTITLAVYSKKNAEYVCLWKNVTIFANDKTIIHEPEQSTYHSDVCHGAYVPLYICHWDDPSGLSGCIMVFLRDTRLWTQAFLHFYDSIISVYNSSHTDETDFLRVHRVPSISFIEQSYESIEIRRNVGRFRQQYVECKENS